MPHEPFTLPEAIELQYIGHSLLTLDELLPKVDVTRLPAPQRSGLDSSLCRLEAHIKEVRQRLAEIQQPTTN